MPVITPTDRDPALWSFGTLSIWNYPIGSNAIYSNSAGSGGKTVGQIITAGFGSLAMYLHQKGDGDPVVIQAKSTDPLQTIGLGPFSFGQAKTIFGTSVIQRRFPVSPDLGMRATNPYGTDFWLTVISADHLTSFEVYQPNFCTSAGQMQTFNGTQDFNGTGWYGDNSSCLNVDLRGPGHAWFTQSGGLIGGDTTNTCGVYYSTGEESVPTPTSNQANGTPLGTCGFTPEGRVAMLGGLVRDKELTNGINHALLWYAPGNMCNQSTTASNGGHGWVFPATRVDPNAFTGTGQIYMGSLLALPRGFTAANTWQTLQGQNFALAHENYGLYIRDGGNGWVVDGGITDYPANSTGFGADLRTIQGNLQVITNSFNPTNGGPPRNGIKIDGGDGHINSALLAPQFQAQYLGGNGRNS